ncbi:hypothetical protein WJX72_000028 [[Myrmecia] bisecta]|uniref:RNA-binding S4 domain-containing protein n=1 Tax=[Myrmecia] bisecta TaxID=41462 RepID=A0AAW1Q6A3_9CHLO
MGVQRPGSTQSCFSIAADPRQTAQGQESGTLTCRVGLVDTQGLGKGKLRLDAFLSRRLPTASRAKLQAAIKEGHVTVNGKPQSKASCAVRAGDVVTCTLPDPVPLEAAPEDIPLDVVFENTHVIVVNKPAGMVVHPSAGHMSGTLVNALLHHCHLPAMGVADVRTSLTPSEDDEEEQEGFEDDSNGDKDGDGAPLLTPLSSSNGQVPIIRPGIVHRLDKGTTGLLMVAKDDQTHRHLSDQFKARTVQRTYWSIVLGRPKPGQGRVETNVGRDLKDRKRMAAFAYHCNQGRHAASNFRVLEELAGGAAALVEWRLDTGRTHQIRVHAKHIGHPLFGDETYGGAGGTAVSVIGRGKGSWQAAVKKLLKDFARPALHAKTLGFHDPLPNKDLEFTSELPPDLQHLLAELRSLE